MWQQNFYDAYTNPTFAFAPAAGRFALGRTIVSGPFDPELPLPPSMVSGQDVRVYQSYNGKVLLRIDCSPVERAGENFALSPDGLQLAVVRETQVRHPATKYDDAYTDWQAAVEVYALPPLTAQDQAAVKEAQALAPVDTGARIDAALARSAKPRSADEDGLSSSLKVTLRNGTREASAGQNAAEAGSQGPGSQSGDQGLPSAPAAQASDEPAAQASDEPAAQTAAPVTEGDTPAGAPRKPPTLYGPGEMPPEGAAQPSEQPPQ